MGTGWRAAAGSLRRAAAGRFVGRSPAAPPPPSAPPRRQPDRVDEALQAVLAVEAREQLLSPPIAPRSFLALDRVVRRPELSPALLHLVPVPLRGAWDGRDDVRRLELPLAADAVVLAKLDLGAQVKLRAGYGEAALALAVQPPRRDGTSGVVSAVRSCELVARHAPGLAPAVRASGALDTGHHYVLEDWVAGRPLASGRRLAEELGPLLEGLGRLHRGYGVQLRRASELWPGFAREWQAVREAGLVGPETGAAVVRLVRQDRSVRVSWTHGDLVASNVIATAHGLTLIDWEHARERPVMFDGARLHLFASEPATTVDRLVEAWGCATGREAYSPVEELTLLHARVVCDAPSRLRRLAGHPRREIYVRQLGRQVELLTSLLDGAGA